MNLFYLVVGLLGNSCSQLSTSNWLVIQWDQWSLSWHGAAWWTF